MPKPVKNIPAFAAALLLLFSAGASAQADADIAAVRAEVATIEKNAPKYKKTEREISGISSEGAAAVYYHSGSELRKIAARVYGEMGQVVKEYYFSEGRLIFAFERTLYYKKHISEGGGPDDARAEELRAYFKAGKGIRLLKGKQSIESGTEEFDTEIASIRESAGLLESKF